MLATILIICAIVCFSAMAFLLGFIAGLYTATRDERDNML